MKAFLLSLIAALLLAQSAQAVVFRRDILTVIPKPPEVLVDENGNPLKEQPEPRQSFRFYTEMRDENALKLDWVHSLSRISEQRTMTILFNPPRYDIIRAQAMHQPLDVISISPEGVILQIVPNLVLAELSQPIMTKEVCRARLILKGGAAGILGLVPGDRIEHPLFTPAPQVMTQ